MNKKIILTMFVLLMILIFIQGCEIKGINNSESLGNDSENNTINFSSSSDNSNNLDNSN